MLRRPLKTLVFVLVAVILLSFGIGAAGSFFGFAGPFGKESPYDWNRLVWTDDGRCSYDQPAKFTSHFGVDVSDNHSWIDWEKAANDGVDFAFIRVGYRGTTEGGIYGDSRFYQNLDNARDAGIMVGTYFFSQATTADEAREEADFTVEMLAGTGFKGAVTFDMEVIDGGRIAGMSAEQVTACAKAFCEQVEKAGYEVIFYGNKVDLEKIDNKLLKSHRIWFAEYGVKSPSTKLPFSYWQYGIKGKVDGIPGYVDVNLWIEPR